MRWEIQVKWVQYFLLFLNCAAVQLHASQRHTAPHDGDKKLKEVTNYKKKRNAQSKGKAGAATIPILHE
jgi:hypothetical protein